MTTVRIPPTLREQTGGAAALEAEGETVRDVLDDLTGRYPALRDRIYDENELARFVNVYVGGEDVRTHEGLETAVKDGSTVILLPAMAGGRLASLAGERSRPAKPGSASASARRRQDAARSGLVRARMHCPAPRALASFAGERPGNRG
ncbi:MAG TPA: ubiquitin-like small modifier protein 1 [Gaiellaceae bacterium]|nr:ubiquitin-like small modifier protein 1 [Gaiellaceae bacterium]